MLAKLVNLIPRCLRRFPDGWCFYASKGRLCAINRLDFSDNRLDFSDWMNATWDELFRRYRLYWRQLPVLVSKPGKNWW